MAQEKSLFSKDKGNKWLTMQPPWVWLNIPCVTKCSYICPYMLYYTIKKDDAEYLWQCSEVFSMTLQKHTASIKKLSHNYLIHLIN